MKKWLLLLLPVVMFIAAGCSDKKDNGNPVDPFGNGGTGGTGGTTSVKLTLEVVQDEQENLYFRFTPDKNIIVTELKVVCTALNLDTSYPDESGSLYTADNPVFLGPLTVLQQGQVWQFTVKGKVESAAGKDFTSTVSYTVK